MRQILQILAAVGGICCLLTDGVKAETRIALVIGNSAYANVPKLKTPRGDAEAMAKLLRDAGFNSVDLGLDLDYVDFKRAVRGFALKAEGADIAVVYYSGHGLELAGTNYLVPVDARFASEIDVPDEAVTLDRLVSVTEQAKKLRVVMLDACRDNPFITKMRRTPASETKSHGGGIAYVDSILSDTLISYATKAGSSTEEGTGDHSLYTEALLKNITVPGLDIRLAMGRVRDQVIRATAGRQEPFVYGSMGAGLVALVPGPVSDLAPPDEIRSDFELIEKLGTRRAFEVFLKIHPSGEYADRARARLEQLETPPPVKPDLGR
jgi:uncharacterized caspase-like protein